MVAGDLGAARVAHLIYLVYFATNFYEFCLAVIEARVTADLQ